MRWSWPSGSRRYCFVSGTGLLRAPGRLRCHGTFGAFSSLPRNRLIRLGNCDGRGLLAHDAAAPSVARACFALPGGFAVTMWMSVCLAAASSIPSYILAAWQSRGSMKKAWATSVCAAFQSRLLEIPYLLRHFPSYIPAAWQRGGSMKKAGASAVHARFSPSSS